ncbi:MAG TPA: hypothetical protein VFT12_02415, partial [Thermoanaerobaculia bacterium]|nr:hypothetical protein [Thermoanaerobaculia bacterium]
LVARQNAARLDIAIIVVVGVRSRYRDVVPLLPDIIAAIRIARPGDVLIVRPRRPDRIADVDFAAV